MRARLQILPSGERDLAGYEGLAPPAQIERARDLARELAGARVLYVSALPAEAADVSASLAGLLAGLGLDVRRAVIHGDAEFASAGADVADALRGSEWPLSEEEWRAFREACEGAAVALDPRPFDLVAVQGAAAAPLVEGRRGAGAWLWRTGVDASAATEEARAALWPVLGGYRLLTLALPDFVPPGLGGERLRILPGAFDPLTPPVPGARGPWPGGIDPSRPILCHLGRLDAWADPLAAVEAWRLAREEAPGLQLAIAGHVDASDPEAAGVLGEIREFAGDAEDLHLVTDRGGARAGTIEAVATLARCAMRCAVGDEFDPEVSRSLWRGTPVVGGGASIAAQVRDGHGGFLAEDPEAQAVRIAAIAGGPRRALQVARAGRELALERFSIVRLLGDELESLKLALGAAPGSRPERERGTRRSRTRAAV